MFYYLYPHSGSTGRFRLSNSLSEFRKSSFGGDEAFGNSVSAEVGQRGVIVQFAEVSPVGVLHGARGMGHDEDWWSDHGDR